MDMAPRFLVSVDGGSGGCHMWSVMAASGRWMGGWVVGAGGWNLLAIEGTGLQLPTSSDASSVSGKGPSGGIRRVGAGRMVLGLRIAPNANVSLLSCGNLEIGPVSAHSGPLNKPVQKLLSLFMA